MFKDESAVNIACSIGVMRQQREWPSGLKESDEVSQVAGEDRPDESRKTLRRRQRHH
jgi:hypothetical protein